MKQSDQSDGGGNVLGTPPATFLQYLRSFGPGLIVVLTWLGAGDLVEVSVAGGNYGYALMWVVVVALIMRFLFVSLIAKYQLCNQHGEGVLDGLARLHSGYPLVLLLAAVVMGHVYGSYMTVGIGEACANLSGWGRALHWAVLWIMVALLIVFRPIYSRIEMVFKLLLGLLSLSLLGTAIWVGPSPSGILEGLVSFRLPVQSGPFDPLLIAVGMIGAVAGSLMNLVYPYFLDAKGWHGPQYRRVQMYDFLLAVTVMIVLDLAIWTLGAEVLHPHGLTIRDMDDLPRLLSGVIGEGGRVLFYLGIFAVVFTSLVGHALGLAYLGSHAYLRWRHGVGAEIADYRTHRCYRWIVIWILLSPLIWTAPGMPGFVSITLVANSAQVVLIPLLAGGLWWITATSRLIGPQYKNRAWENGIMAVLFVLAIWGAVGAVRSVVDMMMK
jgi:Mn2+/Fe2+ NRAMP family transporter